MAAQKQSVSLSHMMELEMQLDRLRKENGIEVQPPLWIKIGDWLVAHSRQPRPVDRKKYIRLALSCGWLCGAHRFYSGHKCQGIIYLLLSWTGFSLAMTLVDVLLVMLKYQPDENGMIEM